MSQTTHHQAGGPRWRTLAVLLFFAIVAGFLLSAEHRAHTLGLLPFLLILALCPLMHMFMHGGHGHGDAPADPGTGADDDEIPGRPVTDAAQPHRH